jgi:hypothetical protein
MSGFRNLPGLKDDVLLWQDTSGYPLPGTIVPCLLCAKPFLMRFYSGPPDQVCPECWETYKDSARVICAKCKVTICRVVPKVLENGFYIRPRSVYHSDACNVCKPGLSESKIVEITEWERTMRTKKIIIAGKT